MLLDTDDPSPLSPLTIASINCEIIGIVVSTHATSAKVQTIKIKGCGTCSCSQTCFTTSDEPSRMVHAQNLIGAEVGQKVYLQTPPRNIKAKAAILFYILPLGGLLAGAFAAATFAPFQNEDVSAVFGALMGFGLTFSGIKAYVKITEDTGSTPYATITKIISGDGTS